MPPKPSFPSLDVKARRFVGFFFLKKGLFRSSLSTWNFFFHIHPLLTLSNFVRNRNFSMTGEAAAVLRVRFVAIGGLHADGVIR